MHHLGPDNVRRQFKGMVERCADCGFDLAGGRVEVVPTAHYMMGGVVFRLDCKTPLAGLYAAGEDTGGVHGANRLGGNGVANSTVFGGIAGETMAADLGAGSDWREPDEAVIRRSIAEHEIPFAASGNAGSDSDSDVGVIREALYDTMWEDVGILRSAQGLARALDKLEALDAALATSRIPDGDRAFNLSWHDWINLRNLVAVSRTIAAAALSREDSRGAHFREDFPETDDLELSTFTVVSHRDGRLVQGRELVAFTRVRPGATLLEPAASAAG
jgi:fumarate reductase flavoprotein subunit